MRAFAFLLPAAAAATGQASVWFGEGCFWERQYAYAMVEMDPAGPFQRSNTSVTSVIGYAGALGAGEGGLVCYDNSGPTYYGALGHCEAVRITLDAGHEAPQFAALVDDFYASFIPTADGFQRPDTPEGLGPMDIGSPFRSAVGVPGGVHGELYAVLAKKNVPRGPYNMTMALKPAGADTKQSDEVNTVWVMDTDVFPFFRGEQYNQFHSNFFANPQQPPQYPAWYLNDLWKLQISLGSINKTGCDESFCPQNPANASSGCHW